ncbi:GNAT family N-acetyltransferase [Streptomyces sp. ID05-04B]|uniref:GNAT family N-acetyltransferase n=1 Tax=Streptomyces sp. P3 TaxID=2135430 RepID=UPI0020B117B3|nr:GNAT family N-acetyltransferase [Streptomyces sp. P3]MDX5569930.1 GNAT family N-acetyltransferase [Streptomyces sp. ID05-04B]
MTDRSVMDYDRSMTADDSSAPEGAPVPAPDDVPVSHEAPAPPYLHRQTVGGFGVVGIRPVDAEADADVVHGWVREERAAFWGMNGLTRDQVADVYAHMAGLDTHHAFLVELDDVPVALFQTYEPAADRVGDCYEVAAGDLGIHLLLAPADARGARSGWSSALMGVLASYVLLGLDRARVVVDPDVRNEKAIARFLRQGFEAGPVVTLPEIDLPDVYLPEKKAQLAFLRREVAFPA